jgi:hypothetical protein
MLLTPQIKDTSTDTQSHRAKAYRPNVGNNVYNFNPVATPVDAVSELPRL